MLAEEALRSVEDIVEGLGDEKVIGSYYLEFNMLDLGAQPFIISCALKRMGYNVVALDVEPEPYLSIIL
jgi:2-polyprenyl-3-methyl-5-hydroxy-6-metoxy-1,4-benzoquinol methylase